MVYLTPFGATSIEPVLEAKDINNNLEFAILITLLMKTRELTDSLSMRPKLLRKSCRRLPKERPKCQPSYSPLRPPLSSTTILNCYYHSLRFSDLRLFHNVGRAITATDTRPILRFATNPLHPPIYSSTIGSSNIMDSEQEKLCSSFGCEGDDSQRSIK